MNPISNNTKKSNDATNTEALQSRSPLTMIRKSCQWLLTRINGHSTLRQPSHHAENFMNSSLSSANNRSHIEKLLGSRTQEDQHISIEQLTALPASLLALQQAGIVANDCSIAQLQAQLEASISKPFALHELEAFLANFKQLAKQLNITITDRSYLPFVYQLNQDDQGTVTFFSGQLENFVPQPSLKADASTRPLLGVQGGVGTEAGVDFIKNIIHLYPSMAAQNACDPDQRPFHLILVSNSATPDRSTKIAHLDDNTIADPGKALFGGLKLLIAMGAEISCVACNTAHYWLSEADVRSQLGADAGKHLSIISALVEHLTQQVSGSNNQEMIVLATRGTIQTGLYQHALRAQGLRVTDLSDGELDSVHQAIYQDIKAGFPQRALAPLMAIADRYPQHRLILCCTELGLVFNAITTPQLIQTHRVLDNNIISPKAMIQQLLATQRQNLA
jgi:aspartate racemase